MTESLPGNRCNRVKLLILVHIFNTLSENYEQLLKKVLAIFKPGKMNVTIMANEVESSELSFDKMF